MKSIFYLKLLFVSVFIVSLPFFSYANLTDVGDEENFRKDVKSFSGHPGALSTLGYKLTKSNTIGGLKCEHYLKEETGSKVRVFFNSNNDYLTVPEDKDDFDVAPNEFKVAGPYRLHIVDGILEKGYCNNGSDDVFKITFPNGNVLYLKDKNFYPNLFFYEWEDFKNCKTVNSSILEQKINSIYNYLEVDIYGLCLKNKPEEMLVSTNQISKNLCFWSIPGVKCGKFIYSLSRDGDLKVSAQLFNGDIIPCVTNDSIISFVYEDDEHYEIKYSNGDWYRYINGYPFGFLHRGNETIKLDANESKEWARMKNADGSVFAGSIWDGKRLNTWNDYRDLSIEKWLPYTGTLRYPDGKSFAYRSGKSEADRIAAEEAKKKKAEAEEKAAYDYLCKKFGKKYVDATETGNILIGMPEELFVAAFKPSLKKTEGNKKCYYVYGVGIRNSSTQMSLTKKVTKVVWVVNGKVASVTNSSPSKVKVI